MSENTVVPTRGRRNEVVGEVMSDKKLQSLFKTFDLDGNGEITKEEMRKAFSKICLTISEEQID